MNKLRRVRPKGMFHLEHPKYDNRTWCPSGSTRRMIGKQAWNNFLTTIAMKCKACHRLITDNPNVHPPEPEIQFGTVDGKTKVFVKGELKEKLGVIKAEATVEEKSDGV